MIIIIVSVDNIVYTVCLISVKPEKATSCPIQMYLTFVVKVTEVVVLRTLQRTEFANELFYGFIKRIDVRQDTLASY